MKRENEWDFTYSTKKNNFLSFLGILLFGVIMISLGFLISYLLFKANEEIQSVETGIPSELTQTPRQLEQTVEEIQDSVVSVINIQENILSLEGEEVSGSGVIYAIKDNVALIVTNNHVIEGATSLQVNLSNGELVKAKLRGYDQLTDLAVLSIPASKVKKTAVLGDSDQIRVGESVIAVGNPLGILSNTVTAGIISSKNRLLPIYFDEDDSPDWEMKMLQTDAAINFGNSGGALFNINGEVIGINSAKVIEEGVESIGFSIPINKVKEIVDELETNGKIKRPYLGIVPVGISVLSNDRIDEIGIPKYVKNGVLIVDEPVGPAEKAGLKKNDLIISIEDEMIDSGLTLRKALYKNNIGDQVEVHFYREGKKLSKVVILEESP